MTIQFVCKIIAKEQDTHTVELNSSNLLALPEENITIRKFNSFLDFSIGDLVYVTKSTLQSTGSIKKLTVEEAFTLLPTKKKISKLDINNTVISEEIRTMILDSNFCPVHVLK